MLSQWHLLLNRWAAVLCTSWSCFWVCSLHFYASKHFHYSICPLTETGRKEITCKCPVNTGESPCARPIHSGGILSHQGFILWQWQISPGFADDTDPSEIEYLPPFLQNTNIIFLPTLLLYFLMSQKLGPRNKEKGVSIWICDYLSFWQKCLIL